jgi:hypothetical protein
VVRTLSHYRSVHADLLSEDWIGTPHEIVTQCILRNLVNTLKVVKNPDYWAPLPVPEEVESFSFEGYLAELRENPTITLSTVHTLEPSSTHNV